MKRTTKLVGGWTNPLENISQIGNLPQIGVKIKNIWNHHQENLTNHLPGKQVAVNFHQLYPGNQPQLPKIMVKLCFPSSLFHNLLSKKKWCKTAWRMILIWKSFSIPKNNEALDWNWNISLLEAMMTLMFGNTLPEHSTWKWWFPIGLSFSRGLFSGLMLVSGRV